MEIRCTELSVVVDLQEGSNHSELPSIVNSIKNAVKKLTTKRIRTKKRLLNRVNAVFEPGTLTLVLGPSGSGKSTLLKVLSGQLPIEKNVIVEGDISYNGRSWKELLPKLPQLVAYVPQTDVHFPTLTVEETLQFANACCDTKVSNNAACIIEQLGLQNCRDTNIGNSLNRGISGGECRRVTLGETEFGMKSATCMDEISTGLDSATTFDIVSRQRDVAKTQTKTVVMSLLQPPEVFELFDNILLLNNGQVVYYGPRKQVLLYFHRLGLLCPMDRDVADFLLDIATEQQYQYELVRCRRFDLLDWGLNLPNAFGEQELLKELSELWMHLGIALYYLRPRNNSQPLDSVSRFGGGH